MAEQDSSGYNFETEQRFVREYLEGTRWSYLLVDRLHAAGVVCRATPAEFRASVQDRQRFSGERDIVVQRRDVECTLESKSRNLVFTDDPNSFPYDPIIVDRVTVWDAKQPEPRAIVFTSQWTGRMLVLPVRTSRQDWVKKTMHDNVRNHDAENYLVAKSHLCTFDALVNWLRK